MATNHRLLLDSVWPLASFYLSSLGFNVIPFALPPLWTNAVLLPLSPWLLRADLDPSTLKPKDLGHGRGINSPPGTPVTWLHPCGSCKERKYHLVPLPPWLPWSSLCSFSQRCPFPKDLKSQFNIRGGQSGGSWYICPLVPSKAFLLDMGEKPASMTLNLWIFIIHK